MKSQNCITFILNIMKMTQLFQQANTKSKQQLMIKTKHRRVRKMLTFFLAKANRDHARSVLVWHSCSVECEVLLLSVSVTLITQLHQHLLTCFYIFQSRRFGTSLLATRALCTCLEMSKYQTVSRMLFHSS